jgi:hypothetical protein
VKGGRRPAGELAEERGGGDAEKGPLASVTRNEQRRNQMQSASAINDAEFRSVARGCTNGAEWRQWFVKNGSSGLTQVVAAQQGTSRLPPVGDAQVKYGVGHVSLRGFATAQPPPLLGGRWRALSLVPPPSAPALGQRGRHIRF